MPVVDRSNRSGYFLGDCNGFADMPIAIDSIEALQRIGQDPAYPLNGAYVLTGDIDASETVNWNDGAGFLPSAPGDPGGRHYPGR